MLGHEIFDTAVNIQTENKDIEAKAKMCVNLAIKSLDRIEGIVIFQLVIKTMHHICEMGDRGDSHPDSADSTSRRCACSSYTASVHSPGSSRCRYHTLDTA